MFHLLVSCFLIVSLLGSTNESGQTYPIQAPTVQPPKIEDIQVVEVEKSNELTFPIYYGRPYYYSPYYFYYPYCPFFFPYYIYPKRPFYYLYSPACAGGCL